MSTFDGFVKEFPHLGIDYFRPRSAESPPVLAYLLSHIHSDHLNGLENDSFGGAFIYCSEITKGLLLKLQIKSARRIQDQGGQAQYKYGHLRRTQPPVRDLLRVLPLNRPCQVQVGHESLTITLLDANHCPGAVMFLIESDKTRILYTGDMRADSRLMSNISTHPILSLYMAGIKHLDCIYLDTSARLEGPNYEDNHTGCIALLRSVMKYPTDRFFSFPTRCMGYEDVIIALSRAFGMCVHVDAYTYGLYTLIADLTKESKDAAVLQCLTRDPTSTRLHSCGNLDACDYLLDARKAGLEVYIKAVSAIYKTNSMAVQSRPSETLHMGETDFEGDIELIEYSNEANDGTERVYGQLLGSQQESSILTSSIDSQSLPRTLVFNFARHSSWAEQRQFVQLFRPMDVQSCTGESSHLYVDLCRKLEPTAAEHQASLLRRLELDIRSYHTYARGDWSESPRIKRKALTEDVNL